MNTAPPSLLLLAAAAPLLLASPSSAESWLRHPQWDEGLAEVCLLEGKLHRYGVLRDATVDLITVREHFDPAKRVKTRPAPDKDVLPILKQNLTRRIRTGTYEYVQMASTFVHRDTGALVKLSAVSSEWCGNSHVLVLNDGETARLRIANYMDDRGVEERTEPSLAFPRLHEEIIPYLRQHLDRLEDGGALSLAAPLLSNNPRFAAAPATVQVGKALRHATLPAHTASRTVTLRTTGGWETYAFADSPLRPLLAWENQRGEYLTQRKYLWLDYWNHNGPGEERLLE